MKKRDLSKTRTGGKGEGGRNAKGEKKRGIVIKGKRYYLSARPLVSEKKRKQSEEGAAPRRQGKFGKALLRLLAVFVCLGFIVGIGGVSVLITWMVESPQVDLTRFEYNGASTVYDINDNFYQQLQTNEVREIVDIKQIPELVSLAFVSIEDQRFYSHFGVDIRGTMKAVIGVLTSGSTEGMGGSTITQQLIKQTHLSSATSVRRKVMEWKLSYQLEKTLTKREILEAYLNKINLSEAWGIESAARVYFGKDVAELSLAQSAVLASIMKAPTYYGPYIYDLDETGSYHLRKTTDANGNTVPYHNDNNKERAIDIIYKMLELGHISEREKDIAEWDILNDNIGLQIPSASNNYTYFTDSVYQQVLQDLVEKYNYTETDAADLIANGGLSIYSTVDPLMQSMLEMEAADDSNFIGPNWEARLASAAVSRQTGDTVEYIPQLGGAVIQTATGYVVGIIGGREKSGNLVLNRGESQFQTGSSTKPVTVYGPAIDSGIVTMADMYMDAYIDWYGWTPANSGGGASGQPMSVRTALTNSMNIVAVEVQKTIGNEVSMSYGRKFGLTFDAMDNSSAALALGGYTYGQTPVAMASAFTTFANGGLRVTPTFYRYVTDANGVIILEAPQETVRVIKPATAWIITDVLKDAVQGGTCWLSIPNQDFAGKTGTTDGETCCWFCGYTKEYAAACWMGYDVQSIVVDGVQYDHDLGLVGGDDEGPGGFIEEVFNDYYRAKGYPYGSFDSMPDGIYWNGDYLLEGTYPTSWVPPSIEMEVCSVTGLIPNETCIRVKKKFIDYANAKIPGGGTFVGGANRNTPTSTATPTMPCTVHHEPPPDEGDDPDDPGGGGNNPGGDPGGDPGGGNNPGGDPGGDPGGGNDPGGDPGNDPGGGGNDPNPTDPNNPGSGNSNGNNSGSGGNQNTNP